VLDLPMQVHTVAAAREVADDRGKMALTRGPLVYAVEAMDAGDSFDDLAVSETSSFQISWDPELLGGVETISWNQFQAIPYYSWSNRGVGAMKVWLPVQE
ncbi:MAG: glycoside hydrolase family 127 protein, partial [Bacteroidia bacterium]|nr:glycoside hydrolase family 127 protein [Bacteroidia bacterium]